MSSLVLDPAAWLLLQNGTTKVGVVEAGDYFPDDPLIDVPINIGSTIGNPKYDWGFLTTPQAHLDGRALPFTRGKAIGGTSALNFLLFDRASKEEYNAWEEIGNNGWNWAGLLPSFKESANYTAMTPGQEVGSGFGVSDERSLGVVGSGGAIQVSYDTYYTDVSEPYVKTMNRLNVSTNMTPDSGNPIGIYNSPTTVDRKTGKRSYSAAYHIANINKSNFVVLTGARATKVNFSPSKRDGKIVASGITFQVNGTSYVVNATKEVILSAGSFQSPQLLELSGIGNATLLRSHGITPLVDLPGVGENMQDHAMAAQMWQVNTGVKTWDELRINQTFAAEAARQYNETHDGIMTSTMSTLAFMSLKTITGGNNTAYKETLSTLDTWLNGKSLTPLQSKQYKIQKRWIREETVPEMEFLMVPVGGFTSTAPANGTSYVIVGAVLQHPFSRGSVHINSSNPLEQPSIDPNYLSSPFDTAALVQGVTFCNKLFSTAPLSDIIATRIDPATNFTTAAHFKEFVKANLFTVAHPVGTCAMAPKSLGGVVDSNLKVWGTANLRVADGSVMPHHVGAHPQSTIYAIGLKAAEMIKCARSDSHGGNNCT